MAFQCEAQHESAMNWEMTNQSLRERFHLGEDTATIASQIIAAATIDQVLLKAD